MARRGSHRLRRGPFCCVGVLLLVACSTGKGPSVLVLDQRPVWSDSRPSDLSQGDLGWPTPDAGPVVPDAITTTCEKLCLDQADFLCIVNTVTGLCIECLSDAHCAGNAGSAGAACDTVTNYCGCSADTDCAGKLFGPRCHAMARVCGCVNDVDCGGGRRCIGGFGGATVCELPCASDGDCAGNLFDKVCTPSGCAECISDLHCGPNTLGPICTQGTCGCAVDGDCMVNMNGVKCLGVCGCDNDLHCPTGKTCTGQYVGYRICQ